ncbi:MAG: hypothetical protein SFV24_19165 [Gemmatimonadales bacterium]|nr:hypothetical protein [Gemmatimonadales bacterium]
MIVQQYLLDPSSDAARTKLRERIEVLERARGMFASPKAEFDRIIADLQHELQTSQPRLVPYDPRVHE